MSIVLKTDPRMFQECMDRVKFGPHQRFEIHGDRAIDAIQDAAAAHAMQMAIEEALRDCNNKDGESEDRTVVATIARACLLEINERAAANLARMMGEGK